MRKLIYLGLTLFGLLFVLVGSLWIYGSFLPATHQASITVTVAMPREKVWALIDDVSAFPTWMPDITKVEMLPERDGHRVFRQTQGRNSFVLEETVKEPPSLVTRTITDDNNMFTGSWEHRLEEVDGGRTKITVIENGTVNSAIPRAIMKLAVGHDFYLKKFAELLKSKCGT